MKLRYLAWFTVAFGLLALTLIWPIHKTKITSAAPQPAIPRIIQAASPAPFDILSTLCVDKQNGFHVCTATVTFKSGDKQYNAVSVEFLVTTEDGKQNTGALATRDYGQVNKVFGPGEQIVLNTPMFRVSNGDSREPFRIIDIAVQADAAMDTDGHIWGNKIGFAAKEFLLRRGGLTQDEIMKSMGLHGGAH